MKVLIYGHNIFAIDMLWGFLELGLDAQIIYPTSVDHMERILEDANPNLLLTLGPPLEFDKNILEYIGGRNSTTMNYVHWDTDGISSTFYPSSSGEGIEMDLINLSQPDVVFTMCPEMLNLICSKNISCEKLHYAYSPITHYPMERYENYKNFINLVGQSYLEIALENKDHYRYKSIMILLKPLLENDFRINFFGDYGYKTLIKIFLDIDVPQECFNGYLPYHETCEVYNNSFINLVTQNHELTLTKRTFEIIGSGGFILSFDNAAIRQLFTPGKDLEVSSSPKQTLELVEYYAHNPDAYKKVRENALLSAQKHTYKQRAETIVEKLKSISQPPDI